MVVEEEVGVEGVEVVDLKEEKEKMKEVWKLERNNEYGKCVGFVMGWAMDGTSAQRRKKVEGVFDVDQWPIDCFHVHSGLLHGSNAIFSWKELKRWPRWKHRF